MIRMLSTVMVLGLVLAIGSGSAFAKGKKGGNKPHKTPEEIFKSLDKDNDGKVTLAEFTAHKKDPEKKKKAEERFKAKDKNNDGSLTLDEMKAKVEKHHKKKAKAK
jgi:Ca2+-binding EF-hand superfamily protein